MVSLAIGPRYLTQPQEATEIDWSHPLAAGLVACINGAEPDATLLNRSTNNASRIVTVAGLAHKGDAATMWTTRTLRPVTGSAATILMVGSLPNASTSAIAGGLGNTLGGNQIFCWGQSGGGDPMRAFLRGVNAGTATSRCFTGLPNVTDAINTVEVLVAVYNGTTDLRTYRNGVDQSGVQNFTAYAGVLNYDNFSIGGISRGSPVYGRSGSVDQANVLGLAWDRALSPDEVAAVSANPWQILRPLGGYARVPVLAAAGGELAGALSASGTLTGTLTIEKPLAGALGLSATLTGDLLVAKPLAGALIAAVTLSGGLSGSTADLAGALAASVTASGDLLVPKPLVGALGIGVTAAGALTVPKPLAGALSAAVTVAGTLDVVGVAAAGLIVAELTLRSAVTSDLTHRQAVASALTARATIDTELRYQTDDPVP